VGASEGRCGEPSWVAQDGDEVPNEAVATVVVCREAEDKL